MQHSLAEELDKPEDYAVMLDNILHVVEKDYKAGIITASNTLNFNVNICVFCLSCFNHLEDLGVFKLGCFTSAFTEVHNSNMSKLDDNGKPIFRADGKVQKGPNYFKPNLNQFINPKYL